MRIIAWLAVLTAAVAIYAVVLRPWMRDKPWADGYFRLVEPVELLFFGKSESLLWARWQQLLGLALTAAGYLGGLDYSFLMPFVDEKYHPALPAIPMVFNLLGTLAEALRRDTTKPIEVVALPEDRPIEVEQAIKAAEVKASSAVEIVKEAKAEGKV